MVSKGDRRDVKRFAWLPTILSDGSKIWWKTYYTTEEWSTLTVYIDGPTPIDIVCWQCVRTWI